MESLFVPGTRGTFMQCVVLLVLCGGALSGQIDELKKSLLDGYDPHVHPGDGNNITVHVGIQVMHLTELDEFQGTMTVHVWQFMWWNNPRLKWDEKKYNLSSIHLPSELVWKPDIELYNQVFAQGKVAAQLPGVKLLSNGTTFWSYAATYTSSCNIDGTNFPHDAQQCLLKFGSWTYDGWMIDLHVDQEHSGAESTDNAGNSQWILKFVGSNKHMVYYECCEEPYVDVTFTFNLERRSSYYNLLLMVPCIVAMILTMGTFLLPPPSGERITMASVAALILIVILLYLGYRLPPSQHGVPKIAKYCSHVLLNVGIALVLSVMGIRKCRVTPIPPPPAIARRVIDGCMGKICCLGAMNNQISEIRMASSPNSVELGSPKERGHKQQDPAAHTQTLYLCEWTALLTLMDRLNFVVFFLNFSISYIVMML